MVERIQEVRPGIPVAFFALCAAGTGPEMDAREGMLGNGLYGGIVGHPEKVAHNLLALEEIGISRINVSPTYPGTEKALAPYLFAGRG
jgi:alkanesulfonate monooxygenase SsuD/methylene tetrahydromethanopterin reductase-like flavin-dependent oxidoreductase (luciferase family)